MGGFGFRANVSVGFLMYTGICSGVLLVKALLLCGPLFCINLLRPWECLVSEVLRGSGGLN